MRAVIGSALVAIAIVFMVPQAAAEQPATKVSPLSGTWEMDPAASKFASDFIIKSETRTYEVDGDKVKLIVNGIDGNDKPLSYGYSAAYDGKSYPMTGSPSGDNLSLKRIDLHTVEGTVRRGNIDTVHARIAVSPDGKRMTFTRKVLRETGEPAVDEIHYSRKH